METTANTEVKIEEGWKKVLHDQFTAPYFLELKQFLTEERKQYSIYPKGSQILRAFDLTPFDQVKVVILGQDPYHGAGQAEGLSFSVPRGIKPPPSLVNIYKELAADAGFTAPGHGHLIHWAEQGVLLLNAVLTVRANQPASHKNKGWETFTSKAIEELATRRENIVFLLWGKYAQDKAALVDPGRHLVLKAAHPSPYSAAAGFFGCKHFSKANAYLEEKGHTPIDWQLPM